MREQTLQENYKNVTRKQLSKIRESLQESLYTIPYNFIGVYILIW